jgi:hypothetical protein
MDERERATDNLDAIRRLRDRARELKKLILNAAALPSVPRTEDPVQQVPAEGSAVYIEIRPRQR